jgi:hypothetical protein
MNLWDGISWGAAILLAASACLIFAFFVRDARRIFGRKEVAKDE